MGQWARQEKGLNTKGDYHYKSATKFSWSILVDTVTYSRFTLGLRNPTVKSWSSALFIPIYLVPCLAGNRSIARVTLGGRREREGTWEGRQTERQRGNRQSQQTLAGL